MTQTRKGVLALIIACTIWGVSGLFYKTLSHVPPLEVLAHRTVWSVVFFACVLGMQRRLHLLRGVLADPASLKVILVAACLISVNWGLFIWSVQTGRATEASMGYYIYPLIAVLLGRILLREDLSALQWTAIALATGAVLLLTVGLNVVPWISLALASTFALYGLIKKQLDLGPVLSVSAEVLMLCPLALAGLAYLHLGFGDLATADGANGSSGSSGVWGQTWQTSLLLMAAGPLTAMPLILFSYGARRLTMATVGIVQYVNPTLQFLVAVLIFAEPFGAVHLAAFALIWTALALYSSSAYARDRARRKAVIASEAEVVVSTKSSSDASAKP